MTRVRVPNLREEIVVQSNTPTQDAVGEMVESWGTLDTIRAEVIPLDADERFQGDQYHGVQVLQFKVRYRSDITSAMRISYNSKIYDLEPPINERQESKILIMIGVERAA